jgi:phage gp46-like protein
MSEQAILRARLSKVEALLARPGHEGERIAAQAAVERIGERLAQLRRENPLPELFPLSDLWADDLLTILESQRVAAYSLYRSQMEWARSATHFMRAALWHQGSAVARFWRGGEPGS